ncbi:sensory neuron membrane protein 2 [Battus philenor]|uniref:sensory neuron membrane protein 2 n=1 Tax=Battus philenor TaxID=42288 RepID=UPI0035D11EFB
MCGIIGGSITLVLGIALVVVSTVITFVFIPGVIEDLIIKEVVLLNNTEQFKRFEEVPFALNFTIRFFNITNKEEVLAGGVPEVTEVGPYNYKLYQRREIESIEDDVITYRRVERLEFDAEGSYPYTENDTVTIANVPYNAILQVAETMFASLMGIMNNVLGEVFGKYNSPVIDVGVREFLFDGILLCENPRIIGRVVCNQLKNIGANSNNLIVQDDGSIIFSLLASKEQPSSLYKVYRGINNAEDLGRIISLNGSTSFDIWVHEELEVGETSAGVCNMINGTDSGLYNPFVNRDKSLYAINTDICRSVEIRYQYDTEYAGIPAVRFAANEWLLDNDDGCFCINVTKGINKDNGCLLKGAMELFNCVGAPLVLSYPHFLYADPTYANGVIGLSPDKEKHRIILELEPNTGTVLNGAKRAQFNVFLRPITSVSATSNLNVTLTPILWIQESVLLPEVFMDQLRDRLLMPLNLVSILFPIIIALCCVVFIVGLAIIIKAKLCKKD